MEESNDAQRIVQSLSKLKHFHTLHDHDNIAQELTCIRHCSSLAENVKLRVIIKDANESSPAGLLNKNGTLNLPVFAPPTTVDAQVYFLASIDLHQSAIHIFHELRATNYLSYFEKSFENLTVPTTFTALYDSLNDSQPKEGVLLGVGMGLVVLEQILWCLCPPEFVPPTRLFKDLLSCSELQQILGPSLLGIIQVLCGLPIGINLRNVVWHGFCNTSEIHSAYGTLLIVLIHTLYLDFIVPLKIDFQERIATQFADFFMLQASDCDILEIARQDTELEKSLVNSYFIIPGREEVILAGLSEWKKGNDYQALVLLLPQLEHSLRRMFIAANHLPSQLLCADFTRYYTTLDIFLADSVVINSGDSETAGIGTSDSGNAQIVGTNHSRKYVRPKYKLQSDAEASSSTNTPASQQSPTSDSPTLSSPASSTSTTEKVQPNNLIQEVGPNLMYALRDIFLYASGPRVRDRIAHGEVAMGENIPRMAREVVSLFLALIAQCALSPSSSPSSPTLLACAKLYQSYSSRWSPWSMLENDFAVAWQSMEEWQSWWNALPARMTAHGSDFDDYLLAYNAQDSTDLTDELETRFTRAVDMSSCKLKQGAVSAYPDPTQLNSTLVNGGTSPGSAPTVRQVAQKAASAFQTLQTKLDGLVSSLENGKLPRRGGAALYKGIKSATCVVGGLRTALATAHCVFILQFSPQPTPPPPAIPPVLYTRLNSLLERANARIGSMEWLSVIETWTEMCKTMDKYIPDPNV